jgi:hypothetical protein
MRSLHVMHEINIYIYIHAYRAGHVCPSVRMIHLENRWTDLDEIYYGHYDIGDNPKIVLFNFLQLVIPTWRTNKFVKGDRH